MFIDTHMHECTYSKDSYLKLEDMVKVAKRRGLGGICITDHDDMGLKQYAEEYAKKWINHMQTTYNWDNDMVYYHIFTFYFNYLSIKKIRLDIKFENNL